MQIRDSQYFCVLNKISLMGVVYFSIYLEMGMNNCLHSFAYTLSKI